MSSIIKILVWLIVILVVSTSYTSAGSSAINLEQIRLPAGFRIHIYARNLPNARSLALGTGGVIFVGTRNAGKVYAVIDDDQDGTADESFVFAEGLNMPNGVAIKGGSLYVAEVDRILRYDRAEQRLKEKIDPIVINNSFPRNQHHGWKYIAFGPDGLLYVPVGAPCNICEKNDPRYASIMRLNAKGNGLEIYARGIRNTVGFDWHPKTNELWFTNNGRDWMGDDLPPDTLHRISMKGQHFGFPYCHAGNIPDPKFGSHRACREFEGPEVNLGPHVAPLGMKFYTGGMFPAQYKNQIFIAEHGSWNRSEPIGYRITLVEFENGRPKDYQIFADGWLQGRKAWGRPVDILIMKDGAMLVSDDRTGAIYRITYGK
jgi:glucose/arabinose dehydrogenase